MFLRLLPTISLCVLSLWVAALIAMPQKPLPNNEVQELVYTRLLGRQHRILFLAILGTAFGLLALVLSMPSDVTALSGHTPVRQQICFDGSVPPPTCYTPQADGSWREEVWQADGTWRTVGVTFTLPHPPGGKDDALGP